MLTYFIVSLLHILGARSTPILYDVPFAEKYRLPNACDLPLGPAPSPNPIPFYGRGDFAQFIHHTNPGLGLFSQAYLWNSSFWRPGAPIVVFLPGESPIDGYWIFNRPDVSTVGVIAENLGAATIVLEHRYYGSSLPYSNFTKGNLQYLTVDNALRDVVRFAQNFIAPWTDGPSTAKDVPWILIGMQILNVNFGPRLTVFRWKLFSSTDRLDREHVPRHVLGIYFGLAYSSGNSFLLALPFASNGAWTRGLCEIVEQRHPIHRRYYRSRGREESAGNQDTLWTC